MRPKTFKYFKQQTALVLAAALTFGIRVPAAAYEYSSNESMYLAGVAETAKGEGNSYTLVDVDGDSSYELLTASFDGNTNKLLIWLYDQDAKTAKKKTTVKKAAAVFQDAEGKKIVVERLASPKNIYVEYAVNDGKLSKKAVYKAVKDPTTGKNIFYKNKKKITAKKYRKYVSAVTKNEELTFFNNQPWADSDIVGTAGAAGNRSEKDDFHLASNYEYFSK